MDEPGEVPPREDAAVETFADEEARFIALLGASDDPRVALDTIARTTAPIRIGRYVLLERLGAGAMGVVHAAQDTELDRRVAIKLLLTPDSGGTDRARALREARALAQLSHPNVVAVFDVGEHDGSVFVAMEYLRGVTLRQWCAAEAPSARAIVDAYRQAADGLAAAHAAGIVHRDFKPDNCLLADDGRVRVLDFGLAGVSVAASTVPSEEDGGDARLTRTGAIMGTPAYMAPEQIEGRVVDARSDQFAFCVALYEALEGERPFSGPTFPALAEAIVGGRMRPWSAESRASPRWRRAVERGLATDPAARHPDMASLLSALDPSPRRWPIAAGVAVLGGAAVLAWWRIDDAACDGAPQRVAAVWSEAHREQIHTAIVGAVGADAAERSVGRLDAYATAWRAAHREACEATRMRGEHSDARLDASMACLDRQLGAMRALVEQLRVADATAAGNAVAAAGSLPPISACADASVLEAELPPPPTELADDVDAVRGRIAEADAAFRLGHYDDAVAIATEAVEAARRIDYPPVEAEALAGLAGAQVGRGDMQLAEQTYRDAYYAALAVRHSAVTADAAVGLSTVVGSMLERHDEGLAWSRHAEAAIELAGGIPMTEAMRLATIGDIERLRGNYDASAAAMEAALATFESVAGDDHPRVARFLLGLGDARLWQGRHGDADAAYVRARDHASRTLAPDHPAVALALEGLCTSAREQERFAEAIELCEGALAIYERAHGGEDASVAVALAGIADAQRHIGDIAAARVAMERAVGIAKAAFGPEHPETARSLGMLAALQQHQGDLAAARASWGQARTIAEATLGADHPDVALARMELAAIDVAEGRHAEALAGIEPSLAASERAHGVDHAQTLHAMVIRALALDGLGRRAEADELLTRAGEAAARLGPAGADVKREIDEARSRP